MKIINRNVYELGIEMREIHQGECFRLKPDGQVYMKIYMNERYLGTDGFRTQDFYVNIEKGYIQYCSRDKIVYSEKVQAVISRKEEIKD